MMAKHNDARKERTVNENTDDIKLVKDEEIELGPLYGIGWALTVVSMIWSLYSIQDLMNPTEAVGRSLWDIYWPGLIVGLGVEAFWGVVQYLAHRKVVIYRPWVVPALAWVSMLCIMGLLVWHGADRGHAALAVAGPLVPLVAKISWMGWDALNFDAADLTDDMKAQLADKRRQSRFNAAKAEEERERIARQHQAELEKIRMDGELTMAKDDVIFEVEQRRQDKENELRFKTPTFLRGEVERVVDEPVPAPIAPAAPRPAIPAAQQRQQVTMNVVDLTPAQARNKGIAAAYWAATIAAPDGNVPRGLFAQEQGISPGQLTKILDRFPQKDFTEEELGQASA